MKKKDKIKIVYHCENVSTYYRLVDGKKRYLQDDFPFLSEIGQIYTGVPVVCVKKILFDYGLVGKGIAWIDKHENVVVRFDNVYKQTKINF